MRKKARIYNGEKKVSSINSARKTRQTHGKEWSYSLTLYTKISSKMRVPFMAHWLTNMTRIHEYVGSIPGLTQWVKDLVLPELWCSCRNGSDHTLLWLWYRPVDVALIQPLAWVLPNAAGASLRKEKRKKKKKSSKWNKVLNVRLETINLIEENTGPTLSDINHINIFSDQPPTIMTIEIKIKMGPK